MAALSAEQRLDAVTMYRSGKSAQQIAAHFNVSIGAVYYALRKQDEPRRSHAEANGLAFESKASSYQIKPQLSQEDESLKLAAVMLYWAEGCKLGKQIDFTNSEPEMVLLFRRFLSEICGVDEQRIRCSIYCYEGQDIGKLTSFWSCFLRIPLTQFTKPYIKKAAVPGPRGPRMVYGLVHIRYCDKKLLRQILDWIEEYKLESVGGRVVNCTRL